MPTTSLPDPRVLAQYDRLAPGRAKELFEQMDKQLDAERRLAERGQWLGFTIAMSFLAASTAMVLDGHEAAGSIIGTVDLVALVAVFVIGWRPGTATSGEPRRGVGR